MSNSSLTPLQCHVLAHYTSGQAKELSIATRWYPHAELIMIIEDKIGVSSRKFGRKAVAAAKAAATEFVDGMIATGAWTTQQNDFGGTMHQFQVEAYRTALAAHNAADPVVAAASAGDDTFWADAIAQLTN
jgi:hypothetical protein